MIASEERITEPAADRQPRRLGAGARGRRRRSSARRARRIAAIVGGQASNEEAYLVQRIVREALGSPHVTCADELDGAGPSRALSAPELGAAIADIDAAESILLVGADPLHSMPILDLRLRKAVRHSSLRLVVASERPTALDGGAEETARYAPGDGGRLPRRRSRPSSARHRPPRAAGAATSERLAGELRPGKTLVIWGEGLGRGPDGAAALGSLLEICERARLLAPTAAARSRSPTAPTPAALARSAACPAPARASPRPTPAATSRRSAGPARRRARRRHPRRTPTRSATSPTGPAGPRRCAAPAPWSRSRASRTRRPRPPTSSSRPRPTRRRRAPSPTPTAASSACAPPSRTRASCARSGRCSPSSPRPSATRPEIDSAPEALDAIAAEVPFYAGLTPDEIGGTGVRWQDARGGARRSPTGCAGRRSSRGARPVGCGRERWASPRDLSRPLGRRGHRAQPGAAVPRARAAGRAGAGRRASASGSADGDEVEVRSNGTERAGAGRAARAGAARARRS